jgi:hypothetical protein
MSTIAVDFDGVIHNEYDVDPGRRMGKPFPGAKENLSRYEGEGHAIIVHTLRGKDPKHVEDWLDYFGIPYHDVTNKKPDADVFIDNRGLYHQDWDSTDIELKRRGLV